MEKREYSCNQNDNGGISQVYSPYFSYIFRKNPQREYKNTQGNESDTNAERDE